MATIVHRLWAAAIIAASLAACQPKHQAEVDRLNSHSYASHYRSLDSTETYAEKALQLSSDYADGAAEALNHLAFVRTMQMRYAEADSLLRQVDKATDNQVELLVACIQQMRLCQRQSRNREFYDYRERALSCFARIDEEIDQLTPHQRERMVYARTEFSIVVSTYYYYVGLDAESRQAIKEAERASESERDTAQLLNYLYNMGSGGMIEARTQQEVNQREFQYLMRCFQLARQYDYPFWAANSLEAIAEHLADASTREQLIGDNLPSFQYINPEGVSPDALPLWLADTSLSLFQRYGDVYQTAGAYRTIATCCHAMGDEESALFNLEQALADTAINQAPDLVASIREQLSVVYAALNNKEESDYWRNLYFDVQAATRQDRYLEARADRYDREAKVLNVWIAVVLAIILLLLLLLWLFWRLNKREGGSLDELMEPLRTWAKENEARAHALQERMEETTERQQTALAEVEKNKRLNLENRAKVSLVLAVEPLIERMVHALKRGGREHLDYVAELTDQINRDNRLLTRWIELRQGRLSLRIESFALQPLLDIVAKGRSSFKMKGITLSVAPSECSVKADRVLTLFMINTLADNARKFTPEWGQVAISAEEKADCVEISVADTGCGMSEEQLSGLFDHKIYNGHGFGLMNCRGIMERYKKVSQIFSVCTLQAESQPGKGSRFFFRLPKGIKRALTLAALATATAAAGRGLAPVEQAAIYLDSAYFCNVEGRYEQALLFADSCREWLNRSYLQNSSADTVLLQRIGDASAEPSELKWFKDSLKMNYSLILDFRNEAATAALALHLWDVYAYNHRVAMALYKEMSADATLPEYCRRMQQQQTNKTVAIILLVLLLMLIPPAWYLLYYRHRLYRRFCIDQVKRVNRLLLTDMDDAQKLEKIRALPKEKFPLELNLIVSDTENALEEGIALQQAQMDDIEMAEDECRKLQAEEAALHVSNSVLDNCLSTLKHETMYYPNRIRRLIDDTDTNMETLSELAAYYRDIYAILGEQALRQVEKPKLSIKAVALNRWLSKEAAPADDAANATLITCDPRMLDYLFEILKKQNGGKKPEAILKEQNDNYVKISVLMDHLTLSPQQCETLFTPAEANIPYLLCRQIVRDLSEATNRRGCGIGATPSPSGTAAIEITLPRKKTNK